MTRLLLLDGVHYIDVDTDDIFDNYINLSGTKFFIGKKSIADTNMEGLKDILIDRLIIPVSKVIVCEFGGKDDEE